MVDSLLYMDIDTINQYFKSILRIRYKLPTVQKIWDFYEFRSFDHAEKNKSLFYNHRGSYEFIQL